MSPATGSIVAACIAVGGVIITAVFALWTARNQRIVSSITTDRILWLTNLRTYVAAFYGALYAHKSGKTENPTAQDVERLGALIRLQLDPQFTPDAEIERVVSEIISKFRDKDFSAIDAALEDLLKRVQFHTNAELKKVHIEVLAGKIVVLSAAARRRFKPNDQVA